MEDNSHLPIALRRTRRSSLGPLKVSVPRHGNSQEKNDLPTPDSSATSTPRKSKKRVRFSDPGPMLDSLEDKYSTGLTPMIRRTSLSSRPARRHSTPSNLSKTSSASGIGIPPHDDQGSPFSGEVYFLPLRQVLDGRVKRRIRRNGLSEEMNVIYAERRRRAQETKAELERLNAELAEKDEEIQRLQDETVVVDTERVWELEQQVEALKRELASRSGVQEFQSSPGLDWTRAARDPFSDDFMDLDNVSEADTNVFGDATIADLACSTPTRKGRASASFPTPPATSPEHVPMTPYTRMSTPVDGIDAGIQTALPDLEKQGLEDELESLQREISKLSHTLESYTSLTTRLADKLDPFSPLPSTELTKQSSAPYSDVEPRLAIVLQMLSDRTAALQELNTSLIGLGFPGSDASEVISSLSTAFRTARLELEYLTPGEVTLPLTSAGAAVLDMIVTRLRELAKKNKEADETIDEYHSIELSLRQQLGARVDAMDTLKADIQKIQSESANKDVHIAELEVGLERLKGAVGRYTRDVSELETLVQHIEEELATSNANLQHHQSTYEQTLQQLSKRTTSLADLEAKLATTTAQTASLQQQLDRIHTVHAQALEALHSTHTAELSKLNRSHGQSLALRDARVAELRCEIDRVNASLRAAHETIRQLRVDNGKLVARNDELTGENIQLASRVEMDRVRAREAVESMKAELQRVVVKMGEGFLATSPKKSGGVKLMRGGGKRKESSGGGEVDEEVIGAAGSGSPMSKSKSTLTSPVVGGGGGLLSGELATKKGKKRRRYDSGLGFLDEEEVDAEV